MKNSLAGKVRSERTAAAKEREPISRKAWLVLGGMIAAGFGLGLWSRSSPDAWFAGILALPLLILPPIMLALRSMDKMKEPQASIYFYALWFAGVGVVVALMFFVFGR